MNPRSSGDPREVPRLIETGNKIPDMVPALTAVLAYDDRSILALFQPGDPMKRWRMIEWLVVVVLSAIASQRASAAGAPDGQRWWSHVAFLADDKLQGRDTGSEGHRQAAEYVAREFARTARS